MMAGKGEVAEGRREGGRGRKGEGGQGGGSDEGSGGKGGGKDE